MNLSQKIAKESTITFSGMVYGNLNRYLYTALLARWVGVEYLGIYSLANAIMLIGEVIAKMGLETGVMRFVSRLDPQNEKIKIKEIIQSALKMTGIFSIGMSIFLLLLTGWLVKSIFYGTPLLQNVLYVFALVIPFNAITLVGAYASQGFKLLKYKSAVTQFLNPSTLLMVMVFSFWFISKDAALALPMAVAGVVGCLAMLVILKKISGVTLMGVMNASINKDILRFSFPLMFVAILQTFMHWMDILMLGYFTNTETVGLYHPAARTAGLLQALLFSFISIYAPLLSNLHGKGNKEDLSRLYQLVTRWLITCSIPLVSVLILFPEKVMLLFGPDYLPSASILVVLTLAAFIQTVLGVAGPTLSMSGFTHLVFRNSLGAFILNLVLNYVLIPKFGIMGAAWATLISLTAIGLARVIEVQFLLKIFPFNRLLYKPILAGITAWIGLWYIKPFVMNEHTLITLLFAGSFGLMIYGLTLWILKLEPEDKDFLSGIGIIGNSLKGKS